VILDGGIRLNLNDYTSKKLGTHFEFMAERSIPDELINETNENIWIVVISYSAMLVYISIAIGQFPSFISSGFSLALIGIVIVLASVVSSMGVIAFLGIGFTMISAEVIPFLVLAIGVDNMFIIKNAIERQPFDDLQQKVEKGVREVGPSIATATVC
jgi:Niemann-Pick C1 protein